MLLSFYKQIINLPVVMKTFDMPQTAFNSAQQGE